MNRREPPLLRLHVAALVKLCDGVADGGLKNQTLVALVLARSEAALLEIGLFKSRAAAPRRKPGRPTALSRLRQMRREGAWIGASGSAATDDEPTH
jgi:hypothetical protein